MVVMLGFIFFVKALKHKQNFKRSLVIENDNLAEDTFYDYNSYKTMKNIKYYTRIWRNIFLSFLLNYGNSLYSIE